MRFIIRKRSYRACTIRIYKSFKYWIGQSLLRNDKSSPRTVKSNRILLRSRSHPAVLMPFRSFIISFSRFFSMINSILFWNMIVPRFVIVWCFIVGIVTDLGFLIGIRSKWSRELDFHFRFRDSSDQSFDFVFGIRTHVYDQAHSKNVTNYSAIPNSRNL